MLCRDSNLAVTSRVIASHDNPKKRSHFPPQTPQTASSKSGSTPSDRNCSTNLSTRRLSRSSAVRIQLPFAYTNLIKYAQFPEQHLPSYSAHKMNTFYRNLNPKLCSASRKRSRPDKASPLAILLDECSAQSPATFIC